MSHARILALALALAALAESAAAAEGGVPHWRIGPSRTNSCFRAEYPVEAQRAHAQGTTEVLLHIDGAGIVRAADIVTPSGPTPQHALLDRAVVAAALDCQMVAPDGADPAQLPPTSTLTYVWRLDGADGGSPTDAENLRRLSSHESRLVAGDRAGEDALFVQWRDTTALQGSSAYREYLFRASDRGYAPAQHEVGMLLAKVDHKLAMTYWRAAAARGHGASLFELGRAARDGLDAEKSATQAYALWLRGAELGDGQCMQQVARALRVGDGVARDVPRALQWDSRLAREGYGPSFVRLAQARDSGEDGRPGDAIQAATLATIGLRLGTLNDVRHDAERLRAKVSDDDRRRIDAVAEAWKVGDPLPVGAP